MPRQHVSLRDDMGDTACEVRHALMRTAIRVRAALRHAPGYRVGRLSRRFAESVPSTCAFGTIWAGGPLLNIGLSLADALHWFGPSWGTSAC